MTVKKIVIMDALFIVVIVKMEKVGNIKALDYATYIFTSDEAK